MIMLECVSGLYIHHHINGSPARLDGKQFAVSVFPYYISAQITKKTSISSDYPLDIQVYNRHNFKYMAKDII